MCVGSQALLQAHAEEGGQQVHGPDGRLPGLGLLPRGRAALSLLLSSSPSLGVSAPPAAHMQEVHRPVPLFHCWNRGGR